jgi:Holliday junction resolvase RusA-like endonuclease
MTSSGNKSVIFKASFPLGTRNTKGKWLPFSGSWYRNAHFHESNKQKKHYTVLAEKQLKTVPPVTGGVVHSLFVLYKPNKRRLDLDNYTTVHKKFYHDALVTHKILKDDDVHTIPFQLSVYGGIDKENPRVDIYVSTNINEIETLARNFLCLKYP